MEECYFPIAIVGAGPAGLSAATNAARLGLPHVLLDRATAIADTVRTYASGKQVMAEPSRVMLEGNLAFAGGSREVVLQSWESELSLAQTPLRLGVTVTAIERQGRIFCLVLEGRRPLYCEYIVLALGKTGAPRQLDIPGGNGAAIDYGGPAYSEWQGLEVVVVGAGDAAIEAALSLSTSNRVTLVHRGRDFPRARALNVARLRRAARSRQLRIIPNAFLSAIEEQSAGVTLQVETAAGPERLQADRVCVRIGSWPMRELVEACGVRYRSSHPDALPELNDRHESSVPGLYIIGGMAGCKLIKPCINQGWEVMQTLSGQHFESASERALKTRFAALSTEDSGPRLLQLIRSRAPIYNDLDDQALEALLIDSRVLTPEPGAMVIRIDDHTDSFYVVFAGSVEVETTPGGAWKCMGPGACFGELSLLTGRRRTANVRAGQGCILIENPRLPLVQSMREHRQLARLIDQSFLDRALLRLLGISLPATARVQLLTQALRESHEAGACMVRQGEEGQDIYFLLNGTAAVLRTDEEITQTCALLRAGDCFGEYALLARTPRMATVQASSNCEVLRIPAAAMRGVLDDTPGARAAMERLALARTSKLMRARRHDATKPDRLGFLLREGLAEATDALIINNRLCIGCNQCEAACADTHGGTSRLQREAGATLADLHVPVACRHCEQPGCMNDCPPNAIHRNADGHVAIDDNCIGCGNCVDNCSYGAIQLLPRRSETQPSGWAFWKELLFGAQPKPLLDDASSQGRCVAGKCDGCPGRAQPACVAACPTGAAIRIHSHELEALALGD